ncbi:hypothetical protein CRUP_025185 [Coryphaenoides rupestris]|nr:hypothetical protein CRUP_025185 [Coryphaenoides rupestris]
MDVDSLQEALKDFDKKGKQETFPLLEQFLCHIAKTGETLVQWPQFKNYFLFKLEKVMEDFRALVPEQRGPANPNVESIPFEDMKERILKIVKAYNGIPFTIQRLCELLTEPRRNYTGTEKFLRGIEKNVMVVSCVHPTSEKNGCSGISRMNGVMLPGNTSAFTERKVNGPGTPRPQNRPKMSLASALAANGLPDSTDGKDSEVDQDDDKESSEVSESGGLGISVKKNKHQDEDDFEEDMEAEQHEVKRLKFTTKEDEDDEDEEDEDEDEEQESDTLRELQASGSSKEAEAMVQEKDEDEDDEDNNVAAQQQHAGGDARRARPRGAGGAGGAVRLPGRGQRHGPDGAAGPGRRPGGGGGGGARHQQGQRRRGQRPGQHSSSSSSSSSNGSTTSSSSSSSSSVAEEAAAATEVREEGAAAPSSSTPEPPTEGATEGDASLNTGNSDEPMDQD